MGVAPADLRQAQADLLQHLVHGTLDALPAAGVQQDAGAGPQVAVGARLVIGPSLIASYASPENEHAAKRLVGHLEPVDSIVMIMNLEAIEAHCNRGIRLESAIARQGKLLAGALTTSRRQLNEVPAIVSRPCLSQHRLELA